MHSHRPAISVITPTFNRATRLVRAIRSVQAQSHTDYEHVIIDDGSSDGTEGIVKQFDDSRIRYLRFEQWHGANAARNAGIQAANAPWLTFLDSDDEFLPHRLEQTMSRIHSGLAQPLMISSFEVRKPRKTSLSINPAMFLDGDQLERALMAYKIFIAGSAITVRTDMLRAVGGFHPAIMRLQDREVLLRLSRVTDAQLLSDVDWVKHASDDSISGARSGYVASLAALLDVHPHLGKRYRKLVAFQVARSLLRDILNGRLDVARESLAANRCSTQLRFSVLQLICDYIGTHHNRRSLDRALA
jgi:glycosyltransferase involved in cell wall biosynthesis